MAGRVKFDNDAAHVFMVAHQSASRLGHATSDVPHLLWALVAEGSETAQRALRAVGLNQHELTRAVESALPAPAPEFTGWRSPDAVAGRVSVSSGFKAIIDSAAAGKNGASSAVVDELALVDALLTSRDPETLSLLHRVGLEPQQYPLAHTSRHAVVHGTLGDAKLLEAVGQYGRLLTDEARSGLLDPVVGREAELRRVGYILGRRRKNNPVLLGEPGVGKTAIVEGLATAIAEGTVPSTIAGKHIFALDLGSLVAGTRYRGDFEERVELLLQWLATGGDSIILFIDEIHLLAGAGGAEGAIDAASFFKPRLARGELRVIGATTVDEYRRYVVHDGALERRFQPVFVPEPTGPETLEILRRLRELHEKFHDVSISDAALTAAVRLSVRRLPERRLPDKTIDLIDEAASRARARAEVVGPEAVVPRRTSGFDVPGRERIAGIEVTPEDVRGVIDEWELTGKASGLRKDVYHLPRILNRQRLAALGRRFRR